jgi:hypothetical protein
MIHLPCCDGSAIGRSDVARRWKARLRGDASGGPINLTWFERPALPLHSAAPAEFRDRPARSKRGSKVFLGTQYGVRMVYGSCTHGVRMVYASCTNGVRSQVIRSGLAGDLRRRALRPSERTLSVECSSDSFPLASIHPARLAMLAFAERSGTFGLKRKGYILRVGPQAGKDIA